MPKVSPLSADDVELRGDMPRRIIDVVDAVSVARRLSRNKLVQEILSAWVDEQLHVVQVIQRVVGRQSGASGDEGSVDSGSQETRR